MVAQLIIDFETLDYGDNLLEYIKGRIQKPSERIVIYFAVMEDLFLKLNREVQESLKVSIIRRNLRPEYLRGLGYARCESVRDLKTRCKLIEADLLRTKQ